MEASPERPGYEIWRPNRQKAESKTTKAMICLILLVSAGLILVITLGGLERLQGAQMVIISLLWAAVYIVFAVLVSRWNRGVLPVAAALAIILGIFAAIASPAWFGRAKEGLDAPFLPDDLLGLLALVLVPVQILLIAIAMIGFNQEWNVEEERPVGGVPLAGEGDGPAEPPPSPAPA